MDFASKEAHLVTNRIITIDQLPAFCDEARQYAPSKMADRVCDEVSTVIQAQKRQTVSWSQIFVNTTTPAFIDKLVFHELGRVLHLDRKVILFGEFRLLTRVSNQQAESTYSKLNFWQDWQSKRQAEDEFWEYEKSYGPPEWAFGIGIALVRDGQMIEHYETACSF